MHTSGDDQVIAAIYDSVLNDGDFGLAVAAVGAELGSHVNAFQRHDFATDTGEIEVSGKLNASDFTSHLADYSRRWSGENVLMERSRHSLLEHGFEFSDRVISDTDLRATDFYRFVLRPMDIQRGCAVCLRRDSDMIVTVLSFHRTAAKGHWNERDIALIRRIVPHVMQANRISEQLRTVHAEKASLEAAFQRLPIAMLMLDSDGTVRRMNESAAKLLDTASGPLGYCGRFLVPRDGSARHELRDALAWFCRNPHSAYARTVLLGSSGDIPSLVLRLCALPRSRTESRAGGVTVLAFVVELSSREIDKIGESIVAYAFGTTPGETRLVLALWKHSSLEAAACATHVTIATARTQLKRVFAKTGLHSQNTLLTAVDRLILAARV